MNNYDHKTIESKWQKIWQDNAEKWQAKDFSQKPKFYTLFEFPYPSGDGLHMGHLRGQTAVDVYARKKRLEGYNVLTPIGWDAFGLPTENYAIKHKIQPAVATANNIESISKQENMLGYFLDWPREINTTDPNYYKWTQWIFLQLFKHGLAYKSDMPINWCPSCKIGLANEEVIDGKCERCGSDTVKRMVSQWMLRITKYADILLNGLKELDFPERVKSQQINWIGKSEGIKIKFKILNLKCKNEDKDEFLEVFTTRPDTLYGVTFMVISPEHALISKIKNNISNILEIDNYIKSAKKKSDLERTELNKDKTGVEIKGIKAINPVNGEEIPIFVADYVLSTYGTGAIMSVPAHDERDYEFAIKYNLPINNVVSSTDHKIVNHLNGKIFTEDGISVNSPLINGLPTTKAKHKIIEWLEEHKLGTKSINYKLRDWVFSRQHYWGEPIPIVFCRKCWENEKSKIKNKISGYDFLYINRKEHKIVPLDKNQLPLLLPKVQAYEPTDNGESPLAKMTDWVNVKCPKCGGEAKRETDTMPNWAGSSWYYLRYIDPKNNDSLASPDKLKYWLPVDLYEGGMEHTTLHLLYSRFWHEFLHHIGVVPTKEPYQKRVPHGIVLASDGRKMSKSLGNVVRPDILVEKYGADTARTYVMFMGPHDQTIAWDENGVTGVNRFLHKVIDNIQKPNGDNAPELEIDLNILIQNVTDDINNFQMNTAIAKLMEFNNKLNKLETISSTVKKTFLQLLYPFSPHITHELWENLNNDYLFESTWPVADRTKLQHSMVNVVIQINSKNRYVMQTPIDTNQDKLQELAKSIPKIADLLKDQKVFKVVVVLNKLINFVVSG